MTRKGHNKNKHNKFKTPSVFKNHHPAPTPPPTKEELKTYTRNLKRVNQAFIPRNLVDMCERDIGKFEAFGEVVQYTDNDFYVYKDNGGSVLGVAHLDSVQDRAVCDVVFTKDRGPIVLSPVLDDRLGAWVITDLLPRLGLKIDWLLTTGEETGNSTGGDFARDHVAGKFKQYNWMFQFDRTGTDVVLYDYDCKDLRDLLRSVGMRPAWGSFSDICAMESMGCKAFNVGVGYEDYHSKRAYAWLDDTFSQVARFVNFYHRYANQMMPHKESKWQATTTNYYNNKNTKTYKWDKESQSFKYDDSSKYVPYEDKYASYEQPYKPASLSDGTAPTFTGTTKYLPSSKSSQQLANPDEFMDIDKYYEEQADIEAQERATRLWEVGGM